MMSLDRILNTIGKSIFVKYYENFKYLSIPECVDRIEENYTLKSKKSRAGHAKMIFNRGEEKEALRKIIKSDRVDDSVRERAQELLIEEMA